MISAAGDFQVRRQVRFGPTDPQLRTIHMLWEQALRQAVQSLPAIRFTATEPESNYSI
jgi:predicted proteasome-type protease